MNYKTYKVRVYDDGTKEWYLNGKLHREDGPAIEGVDGSKEWFLNGKPHREDGPAIEGADGTKAWFLNGKLHREDGPAYERADGSKEWWLNGEELTKVEWKRRTSPTIKEMTVDEISKKLGFEVKVVKG